MTVRCITDIDADVAQRAINPGPTGVASDKDPFEILVWDAATTVKRLGVIELFPPDPDLADAELVYAIEVNGIEYRGLTEAAAWAEAYIALYPAIADLYIPTVASLDDDTLRVDITNGGGTNVVSSFVIEVRDGPTVVGSTTHLTGVLAGQTIQVDVDITVGVGATTLDIEVDKNNDVVEYNESNQIFAGFVHTVAAPDLTTLSAVQISDTKIDVTIQNGGTADIVSPTPIAIEVRDGPTVVGTASFTGGLAQGASTTVPVTVTLSPGSYSLDIFVDPANTIAELNETNNDLLGVSFTIDAPDLDITGASQLDDFTVRVDVKNAGTAAILAGTPVTVRVKDGPTQVGEVSPTDGWAIGQTRQIDVPVTLAWGSFTLDVFSDPDDTILELDEANNDFLGLAFDKSRPDLYISGAVSTDEDTVTVTIGNSGNEDIVAPTPILIEIKDGPTLVGSETYTGGLAQAATQPVAVSITPGYGTFSLDITVDPANTIPEQNEGNNVLLGHPHTKDDPDLYIQGAVSTDDDTITVTIGNSGNEDILAPTPIKIEIKDGATLVGTFDYTGGLAQGATTPVAVDLVPPLAPGSYSLDITVDPANTIPEQNEADNTLLGFSHTVTDPALCWYGPQPADIVETWNAEGTITSHWAAVAGGTWGQRYEITIATGTGDDNNDPINQGGTIFNTIDARTEAAIAAPVYQNQYRLQVISSTTTEGFRITLGSIDSPISVAADKSRYITYHVMDGHADVIIGTGKEGTRSDAAAIASVDWIIKSDTHIPSDALGPGQTETRYVTASAGQTGTGTLRQVQKSTTYEGIQPYTFLSITPTDAATASTTIVVEIGTRVLGNPGNWR